MFEPSSVLAQCCILHSSPDGNLDWKSHPMNENKLHTRPMLLFLFLLFFWGGGGGGCFWLCRLVINMPLEISPSVFGKTNIFHSIPREKSPTKLEINYRDKLGEKYAPPPPPTPQKKQKKLKQNQIKSPLWGGQGLRFIPTYWTLTIIEVTNWS